jgi:hypothetical protein
MAHARLGRTGGAWVGDPPEGWAAAPGDAGAGEAREHELEYVLLPRTANPAGWLRPVILLMRVDASNWHCTARNTITGDEVVACD